MPKIIQLPAHVADLIAAGEVVERPGSVVKELMENAIDAGASALTVEIQNGGMSFIRVSDNGCGIEAEYAKTAFLRHATSKLRSAEDLAAIGTLGFRGEALAAIAAVSKVDLLTRARGAAEGVSLYLEGGEVKEQAPAGCPEGTTIIIRELFFNTPARLKFMKKDAAEGSNVLAVASRLALSHPEVSIKFIKDGREELHTPGDGKLSGAVYSVLGRDFATSALPCAGSWEGVAVSGLVSVPTASRGNRGWQFFFVNGRWVKSTTMQAALEQAYKNRIMTGRFPACVLHITIDIAAVDVNVHPAKTEVKFVRDKDIFDGVYYAVLAALGAETARPEARLEPGHAAPKAKNPDFFKSMTAEAYRSQYDREKSARKEYSKAPVPDRPVPVITERESGLPAVHDSFMGGFALGSLEKAMKAAFSPPAAPEKADPEPVLPAFAADAVQAPENAPPPPEQPPEADAPQRAILPESETPWFRVLGEVLSTYIVVEESDGLLLIDKHAAHERILFNRYKSEASALMSQNLLLPVIFKPRGEEFDAIMENEALLSSFGYEVSDFGGGSIAVRQVPADIDGADAESALCELAAALLEGRRLDPAALRDELLHTLACKAAIKAGSVSGKPELEALALKVLTDPEVRYCPHGRPVAVAMSRASLEKQFKRT